ncbi:LLM class flavin-dependent oxidoreductase [Arthrobacter sp. AOP36-C1-22]|uniref:LLM class flavin-dependent oxidoreductase n=1 Tax=Arthrobacter sp. AOP36-C1-22 TaxID=3457683 RepID=UPI004033B738
MSAHSSDTAPRQLHFNAFLNACGHHQAAWRHPGSAVEQLGDIEHYERLARTAETGLFDAVFFADGHSAGNPSVGPRWFFEPLTALAAMARNTSRIGLISTVSTTFYTPYHAARMLASLDHISAGRIGWNVVTSMFDAEARNHSMDAMPASPERYARAAEFIDVALGLWDSWADDAVLADREGLFADPEKVRPINHDGEHFSVDGPLNVPRGPQGRPVLFQAGASESGRQLAARHAEGIYAVAYDLASGQDYYADLKRRIAAEGRDPSKVAIMPGLVTFLGSTEAEALAGQAEVDALLPTEQSLAQLGMFIGQDCRDWDLDAPVPTLPPASEFTGPQGRYATILRIVEAERPTVRQLLGRLAAGGGHCTMVGTPEQVADSIERWFVSGAADGFNLMPPMLPDSLEEFVDRVVPVLQRRGLYRTEYSTDTLRGHLGLERPVA